MCNRDNAHEVDTFANEKMKREVKQQTKHKPNENIANIAKILKFI